MGANCCGSRDNKTDESLSPPPVSPRKLRLAVEDCRSTTGADQTPVAILASPRKSPRKSPKRKVSLAAGHDVIHSQDTDNTLHDYEAASKDAQRMIEFVRHLVVVRGGCVESEEADAGLVRLAQLHCSGQSMVTFEMLQEQLDNASWAQPSQHDMTNGKDRTLSAWYDNDAPNESDKKVRSWSTWFAGGGTSNTGTQTEIDESAQEYEIFSRRGSHASQHKFHDISSRRGSYDSVISTPRISD